MTTRKYTPEAFYASYADERRIHAAASALQGQVIADAVGRFAHRVAAAVRHLRDRANHGGTAHPTAA